MARFSCRLHNQYQRRDLGILVDTKLNVSQQCSPVANMANSLLYSISKSLASRWREVILLSPDEVTPGAMCP